MFRLNRLITFLCSLIFISHAVNATTLTVYSYSSFLSEWGPGSAIKKGFEAQCNCTLNIVPSGDGVAILNRVKLEGSKTKADVIVGLDNNVMGQAKLANIVLPHQITKPDNLRIDWWDTQFMPYDYGYFAFIYNQDKLKNPPQSLHELIENKPNWKIVYQDPRTSTPGLGLLFWMQKVYGDSAVQAWKTLSKHTLTVTKGWSEAYGLFLQGEADLVLSYSTSPAAHMINEDDNSYVAAIFDEGHYRQVEVAAIVKYTKHPELAQAFLNYLLTDASQRQFAEKNVMYPIMNIELPGAYQQLKPINKALEFDNDTIDKYQKIWVRQWQTAVSLN